MPPASPSRSRLIVLQAGRFAIRQPSCRLAGAISSAGEHYLDMVGVTGSISIAHQRLNNGGGQNKAHPTFHLATVPLTKHSDLSLWRIACELKFGLG